MREGERIVKKVQPPAKNCNNDSSLRGLADQQLTENGKKEPRKKNISLTLLSPIIYLVSFCPPGRLSGYTCPALEKDQEYPFL